MLRAARGECKQNVPPRNTASRGGRRSWERRFAGVEGGIDRGLRSQDGPTWATSGQVEAVARDSLPGGLAQVQGSWVGGGRPKREKVRRGWPRWLLPSSLRVALRGLRATSCAVGAPIAALSVPPAKGGR
jgi:hypothetical protein